MAFLFRVNDLKPISLRDVPVGSVVSMIDNDETLYVRLDHASAAGGGTFLPLNADMRLAHISPINMDRKVLCLPAGELHISIDAAGGRSTDIKPGQIVLTEDGPIVGAQSRDGAGFQLDQYVSMSTWQMVDFPGRTWTMRGAKLQFQPSDRSQEPTLLLSF